MSTIWPLYVACCMFLLTLSLGTTVQYSHVRLGRWRIMHHVLFFGCWLTTLGASASGLWWRAPWWWLPLLLVPVLALFPRRKATTRSHRVLALSGLLLWLGILTIVWVQ